MTRRSLRPRALPALSLLSLAVCGTLQAEVPVTQNDWGGIGLLQTPTARMAEEGEFAFTASHASPYTRYNVAMQPFPWFEGVYRYANVQGVRYGSIAGDQNYKDKSIDFKIRLWEEGRWLPQVAIGAQDIGGTGLFASEYVVANKRFGQFDASLGLATGYLGSNGDFGNPIGWIDEDFKVRPRASSDITQAGKFGLRYLLHGRMGVFGGVAWQTPWQPLLIKVEYDGHDYDDEVRVGRLEQDSRINIGLHYTPSPGVRMTLGWERGNELLATVAFRGNLKNAPRQPRWLDPPKFPLRQELPQADGNSGSPTGQAAAQPASTVAPIGDTADRAGPLPATDGYPLLAGHTWEQVRADLASNAGFQLRRVEVNDNELILHGNQVRYVYLSEGLGRAARVLDQVVDPSIEWVTLEYNRQDMPIAQSSVSRSALAAYARRDIDLDTMARSVELNPPGSSRQGDVVYDRPLGNRFSWGVSPGLKEIIGGPDGFILYQLTANATANWMFSRSTWLTGTVSADLLNNFDKFKYDAPSNLPRVRTDIRQYVTTSDVTVPNFQLTSVRALGRDLYGMAYAGLLEEMYGGVGGELLYRPLGQPWALGFDANWVKQREYDQRFSFRDYDVATGHATLYYNFGQTRRVHVATSVGRYLAGDWGVTLDVSRVFANGAIMGAFATKTNVSSAEFGEGSFDKGIYLSVPMDLLMPRSSRARANLMWHPLVRDGGARLVRRYNLYTMTGERDQRSFYENIKYIDP